MGLNYTSRRKLKGSIASFGLFGSKYRLFLRTTLTLFLFLLNFLLHPTHTKPAIIRRLIRRMKNRLMGPKRPLPAYKIVLAEIPWAAKEVSVEMVLNSRCTSGYDEQSDFFHWGLFDNARKLSAEHIEKIISLSRIPRFTAHRLRISMDQSLLTFTIDNHLPGTQKDWAMVESGMQQQAVCLVCASLGIGTVFNNLGKDGLSLSATEYATTRIRLSPMNAAYFDSFWTDLPPLGWRPWRAGNLPNPARRAQNSFMTVLGQLEITGEGSDCPRLDPIGQILWAARGRTPHLYNSRPWGLTIPTWAGEQSLTCIYCRTNDELLKYVNWIGRRPTHALEAYLKLDKSAKADFERMFFPGRKFIILSKNEHFARALWEVGYQLLNLMLQSRSLGIKYRAILIDESQKEFLNQMGLRNPVAMFII